MSDINGVMSALSKFIVDNGNEITDKMLEGSKEKTRVKTGRAKAGWEIKSRMTKPGSTAVIINEVPYIGWLNFGTAYTEGDHMVERTVQEVQQDYK